MIRVEADGTQRRPSAGSGQAGEGWRRLVDLAALGLHGVTRIAISPKGDRIAFVTQAP